MTNAAFKVVPVVLCGGSGSRLWPLSRMGFPKQFLVLSGTMSLFQKAIKRINGIEADDISVGGTLIVTGEDHRFLALDHLREIKDIDVTLLLEPVARNTAPALTFAALQSMENGEDPILVVAPADQELKSEQTFKSVLQNAVRIAADGSIIILGILPDKPETGYGYINVKAASTCGASQKSEHSKAKPTVYSDCNSANHKSFYVVEQFVEKPDLDTALQYLNLGGYYWNSGIVVLKASVWIQAMKIYSPAILDATKKALSNKTVDAKFIRPDAYAFSNIPSDSIDYAVLEKLTSKHSLCNQDLSSIRINMLPLDAGWSDLGSWDAVWELGDRDSHGNVTSGDTLLVDTSNTFLYSTSRLVSAVGVNNLVIVETDDAILIADKNKSQDVRKIVKVLEDKKRTEHLQQRKVHRPWGWYDSVDEGNFFKVKRITVNPGASLSLQKHRYRAEHWVVVKGVAEVSISGNTILLNESQSTYIPVGEVHRLSNPGAEPLELIEVQTGSYLGEDDIIRVQDDYGR